MEPKRKGGLGFGSLRSINLALLAKWWWRFKSERLGLWKSIITHIHSYNRSASFIPARRSITSPWKQIANIGADFVNLGLPIQPLFRASPGSDSSVRFWLDTWLADLPLCDIFPNLFVAERKKHATIKERITPSPQGPILHFSWLWSAFTDAEMEEFSSLNNLLLSFEFREPFNTWRWTIGKSARFSVSSLRIAMESLSSYNAGSTLDWNNWVPIKVNFFAWRILNNGVPTAAALSRRGIVTDNPLCPLCKSVEESTTHLFGTCSFATSIWEFVSGWCNLPPLYFLEQSDIVHLHRSISGSKFKAKALQLIFLCVIWSIWKHRNAVLFEGKDPSTDLITREIKSLSFLWIKSRSKFSQVSWSNWCSFNCIF